MSISKLLVINNFIFILIGTLNIQLYSVFVIYFFVMLWWVINIYYSIIGKLGVFIVQFYGYLVGVFNFSVID